MGVAGGMLAGGLSDPAPRHAVIPAKAGISTFVLTRDPRLRGDDGLRGDDSGYRAGWPGGAG